MNKFSIRISLILIVCNGVACCAIADEPTDYLQNIKPLLAEKCSACHGPLKQESNLRLDAGRLILKGGDSGPAITPGDIKTSLLLGRVNSDDPDQIMPPHGEGEPLSDSQIGLIEDWIRSGATIPLQEEYLEDPLDHWAYQPPVRPAVPLDDPERIANPIDAFILKQQRLRGLIPSKRAEPHAVLRRVYVDLIGLPPTRKELKTFVENPTKDALQDIIDAQLASSSHGERWGRHWMDVWRYSDWDGYKNELRGSQRHIWHWRDWIIKSLNQDKGYDQMVAEMLAADELFPDDPGALAATGFLARNFHVSNRNIWLDATVEHTAKAFLGMTLNCARCHDHKYDPIPQTAFYQFRAIFEPHQVRTDFIANEMDKNKNGLPRVLDIDLDAQTFLYVNGNEKQPDKDNPLPPGVVNFPGLDLDIQEVTLPVEAYYPELSDAIVTLRLEQLQQNLKRAALAQSKHSRQDTANDDRPLETSVASKTKQLEYECAQLQLESYRARWAAERARYFAYPISLIEELSSKASLAEKKLNETTAEQDVFLKQVALDGAKTSQEKDAKKKQNLVNNATKQLDEARKRLAAAKLAVSNDDGKYSPLGKVYPKTSSGRRLALARWISNRRNPLTARVAVNHIWLRHFGAPLVANVFDFGLRAPKPVHVELLDWLAVELMETGWSMKHIHRLILNSNTWQQSSSSTESAANRNREIDPDNLLFWRMNPLRMDAEVVRDSLLSVSNQLDQQLGGPEIDFRQSETSLRRSIYLGHAYEKQAKMLLLFDVANPNECYRRSDSVIPQQALALVNSSLCLEQSRHLASSLWIEVRDLAESNTRFIEEAFLQVLSRPPSKKELAMSLEFLDSQSNRLSDQSTLTPYSGGAVPRLKPSIDPAARSRENLVHVLMNHNDFVTTR